MELRWAPGLAAVVGDCDRALRLGAASDGAVLLLQSAAGDRRCGRGGDHGRSAPPAGRGAAPWLAAAAASAAAGAPAGSPLAAAVVEAVLPAVPSVAFVLQLTGGGEGGGAGRSTETARTRLVEPRPPPPRALSQSRRGARSA